MMGGLYKGGSGDLERLIALEWRIIRKLEKLAKEAQYDKHRAIYYQNLAAHARTLAFLVKLAGPTTESSQDLAKLLADIDVKLRKFVLRLDRQIVRFKET